MIGTDPSEPKGLSFRVSLVLLLGVAALSSGCVAPGRYMGLSPTSTKLPADLRELVRRARAGDRQAQLKLGSYYQYAADGLSTVRRDAASGQAQMADVEHVEAVFAAAKTGSELRALGSWRLLAMNRARDLYRLASSGDADGPARARLSVIEEAISQERYATHFGSPYVKGCMQSSDLGGWKESANFIAEGVLTFEEAGSRASDGVVNTRRSQDFHYRVHLDVRNFLKWPEKIDKPATINIEDHAIKSQVYDDMTGFSLACDKWDPTGLESSSRAIVVLQLVNEISGPDRFEILATYRSGLTN